MQLEELIGLMEKYTFNGDVDGELGEQDAPAAGASCSPSSPSTSLLMVYFSIKPINSASCIKYFFINSCRFKKKY